MSDPEPAAAVPPTAAMPNAAAVAHASMHGTEPSDPATRVAFLEANLEMLGRMLDAQIGDLKRTRAMVDLLLNKPKPEKPKRQRKESKGDTTTLFF